MIRYYNTQPDSTAKTLNDSPERLAAASDSYSSSEIFPRIGTASGRPAADSRAEAASRHSATRLLNVGAEASAPLMPENASRILNGGSDVPAIWISSQ